MPRQRLKTLELHQRAVVARRRVFRHAFDLIRHDPQRRELVSQFAGCLGIGITMGSKLYSELYERAAEMCALDGRDDLVWQATEAQSLSQQADLAKKRRVARRQIQRADASIKMEQA